MVSAAKTFGGIEPFLKSLASTAGTGDAWFFHFVTERAAMQKRSGLQ